MEAIDIIDDYDLNFCLGNAIKYILRAGKKSFHSTDLPNEYFNELYNGRKESLITDLEKAIWYLQREIEKNKM